MKTLQTKMLRSPAAQTNLSTQFTAEPYEPSGEDHFSENHSSDENDESDAIKLPLEVQLIKYIASEQALYNPKHQFYRNSVRKDEKWLKIGAAIGWSEVQCKAKWKAFRDQYCRELKRSKKNPKASVKWKYFKYLEFLRPFALSRNYRPRYVPTTNASNNSMATTTGIPNNNNDYKLGLNPSGTITAVDATAASLIASDFSLLQSIKLEPPTQQEERQQQQQFVDNCTTTLTTTSLNNATTQHNIKNETIVVIAAEQFQHLDNVYQHQHTPSQQQQQRQQELQQQQHIESWSFLTSTTTTTANGLLNQQQTTRQTTQQQISNETHNGHGNSNNTNAKNNFSYIHNTSNSSTTADADACLYNAFANCVAAAEADAAAAAILAATNHENNSNKTEQLQQKSLPIFMPPPSLLQTANNAMTTTTTNNTTPSGGTMNTTSSDEDDDSIHTFLNIESYFEKELIANVQSEHILYNSFHPNYRNVKIKLDVWADIARKMKKTVKQCRLKWKALRDQYIREHKRLRNRENIESVPRWKHYDALDFLHKFIKHKSEIEEKQIFHLPKNEIELSDELMISADGGANLMQHEPEQQKLQLHATLIDLNDASVEQSLTATAEMLAEATNQQTTTQKTAPSNTLVAISDNHDAQHDYDAMDIDEYIITEASGAAGGGDADSTHQQLQLQAVDGNNDDGVNDNENNVADDDDDCLLSDENQKALNQLHQSYTNDECLLQNEDENDTMHQDEFENLKHMVEMPLQAEQQQQQHQTPTSQTPNQEESIMHVVGLGDVEDELVVINNASVAQLGFVVTATTTTPEGASIEQQQQLQRLHQQHSQQAIQSQQTNFVAITKTSPNVVPDSLEFYNNHNVDDEQQHNTNNGLSHVGSHNNSNNNTNNIVASAHDVGSVLSAIASCADFAANYNQTIVTPTTASIASSTPSTSPLVATHNVNLTQQQPPTIATSTTTSSTVSSTISSTAVTNLSPNTSNVVNCAASTPMYVANTTHSTASLLNTSSIDEDEVGTFFHSITMKVRSLNLSPIEFTDLQIEVLRVINRSIRKN